MRYILNFNPEAADLLGAFFSDTVEFTTVPKTKAGASILVRATDGGDGPALGPVQPGSSRYKVRLNEKTARSLGLRGSQRYTINRRGQSDRFYLVPHSQVRNGVARRIDGPAVTVSITERS